MLTLHLGVIDMPYSARQTRRKRKRSATAGVTTFDVAGWLEAEYHVMEHFYELHQGDIAASMENGLAGALENVMMGASGAAPPLASAESEIEDMFKRMLSERELDRLGYPGLPTQAALRGVNHRMGRPYARRGSRPSFVDTGLYQSSFKAWFD